METRVHRKQEGENPSGRRHGLQLGGFNVKTFQQRTPPKTGKTPKNSPKL